VVQLLPKRYRLNLDGPGFRINQDKFEFPKDQLPTHHPPAKTSAIMPAPLTATASFILPAKVDGLNDIGDVHAFYNHSRMLINHGRCKLYGPYHIDIPGKNNFAPDF